MYLEVGTNTLHKALDNFAQFFLYITSETTWSSSRRWRQDVPLKRQKNNEYDNEY